MAAQKTGIFQTLGCKLNFAAWKKRKQFYLNHLGEKREVLLERPVNGQVHPVNALVPLKLEAYAEEQECLVYARN